LNHEARNESEYAFSDDGSAAILKPPAANLLGTGRELYAAANVLDQFPLGPKGLK
jgi:hypothetical protein